jgi:LacI family transcriptional regulator
MTTLSTHPTPTGGGRPAPKSRQRATMRDVAALAGVAIKTVSRVVNDEPGVSPAMVERVRRAADELNFQADMLAGNLRRTGRRTKSIGLVLASVDNPFAAAIHRAVEDVAETQGVAVFSASTDEKAERERSLVEAFTSRRVDGLIITSTGTDQQYLLPEMAAGTPVVAVDRPPVGIDVDTVVADNVDGARQAVEHLIAAGHERIAFMGDLAIIATAAQRFEGFEQALTRAGIPIDPSLVTEDLHDEQSAFQAAMGLLLRPIRPSAIFASQNLVTIGAFRALRTLGLHHTIALVGFDDFSLADLLDPPVTVVAQDPFAMGRAAAERLFGRMTDEAFPPQRIVVPTRLITRGSGEIRPSTQRGTA